MSIKPANQAGIYLQPYMNSTLRNQLSEGYVRHVESCFRRRPETSAYYQQLLDYLSGRALNSSQIPSYLKAYDICDEDTITSREQDQDAPFDEVDVHAPRHGLRLLVVRGHPAPEVVGILGAKFCLPPELFLGHLELPRCKTQVRSLYELPTIPSRQKTIAHVRLITLAKERIESNIIQSHAAKRVRADERNYVFEKELISGNRYGATRFRRTNIHNANFFSVEQTISVCVTQRPQKDWSIIILQDQGHSLANLEDLPWSTYTNAEFIPTVYYNEMPASPNATIPDVRDRNYRHMTMESVHPYSPLVDCRTTCAQDRNLLRQDPFFLIGQLLCTSLLSWNQMVNFLEEDVREYQFARSNEVESALEQLRYNISLIDRMKSHLKDNLATIDQASLQPMEDDLRKVAQQNRDTLRKDHEWIIERCQALSARCEVVSNSLLSMASFEASQRSILESNQINRLTKLAFIFIPMSFVASVFGMNVAELAQNPPIWVFFLVAIPIVGFTITVMNWKSLYQRIHQERQTGPAKNT